mmetsp:Transcript_87575/g.246018  ORF Transcript_87575/g.246018 Transcript_87575/m.246018 type:complete len:201 (+) Transcript_87575:180-782(+)
MRNSAPCERIALRSYPGCWRSFPPRPHKHSQEPRWLQQCCEAIVMANSTNKPNVAVPAMTTLPFFTESMVNHSFASVSNEGEHGVDANKWRSYFLRRSSPGSKHAVSSSNEASKRKLNFKTAPGKSASQVTALTFDPNASSNQVRRAFSNKMSGVTSSSSATNPRPSSMIMSTPSFLDFSAKSCSCGLVMRDLATVSGLT